jgi:protein TonB
MSVVVSTFPSLNSFNSRSWTLVAIVALHVGFFWLLSSGGMAVIYAPPPEGQLVTVKTPLPPPKPSPTIDLKDPAPIKSIITLPPQPKPYETEPEPDVIKGEETTTVPPVVTTEPAAGESATTQPMVDSRFGLSEPPYPASERRDGHQGTVMLAIEVLENGRIGQVRIESSSGYERLDEAAVRQAKRWRLKPGMRDGVPVIMWKRIPVHFRLTEGGERF